MKRIAASYVFTLENRTPIRNGFVELEDDGTIIRTGVCTDIESEPVFYEGAITPGFVNSHCHSELSHLKSKFRKGSGMAGFIDQINDMRDSSSREEKIACLSAEFDNLWKQGVSAMADISNCDDSFALKAVSPIYTRTFLEVFGTEPEDCGSVISNVKELACAAAKYGIDASVTPHASYTMSPELVTASSALGLATGYLSYHSQESPQEEEMFASGTGEMAENRRRAGMSTPPVTGEPSLMYFIDRLSAVHDAPFDEHILLVHNVCLTKEAAEAALQVFKNVYWAVCPLSNLFIHNMLPPVLLMRDCGLKITVGTDSLSSNDILDMTKEMYCLQSNFPELELGEILEWTCRNGAEFLSKSDELGTLEKGKRPGIVLVDRLDSNGRLTPESSSVRLA